MATDVPRLSTARLRRAVARQDEVDFAAMVEKLNNVSLLTSATRPPIPPPSPPEPLPPGPPGAPVLIPSMITAISIYSGKINLPGVIEYLKVEPWATGVWRDMPVGPDGSIVAVGYNDQRCGAIRTGRSDICFRNAISVDISALGGNVNIKVSAKGRMQLSGGKTRRQCEMASALLIDKLNQLPSQLNTPLTLLETHIKRVNCNFSLGYTLDLSAVARLLDGYEGMIVIYDNMLNQALRAGRLARDADRITEQRSMLTKRAKTPAHLLLIRKTGKIMIGGPDIDELNEIYAKFIEWANLHKKDIMEKGR